MLDPLNHAFRVSYLILWMVVFARQACLPVPANLFLLTAGALARGGELNMLLVLVIGVWDASPATAGSELGVFYDAIYRRCGLKEAKKAGQDWIEELETMDWPAD